MSEIRLTKAQFEAWGSFGPEWEPFKLAWLAKGFRLPPEGEATDDPRTSLRSRLWEIAEMRPHDLGRWVALSRGKTPYGVVREVFQRWLNLREEFGNDDWLTFDAEKRANRNSDQPEARKTLTRISEMIGR